MTRTQMLIDEALAGSDAFVVTDQLKEAVARELSAVDPSITVRKTDYFNHTFVPDLVAWWGDGVDDHRPVYLRFDAADPYLAEDVERLSRDDPMFFSLRTRSVDETSVQVVESLQQNPRTMVTNPDGVDALTGASVDSFDSLITSSIVKSGRGVVDEDLATAVRVDASGGIEAALLTNQDGTRKAALAARSILNDHAAQRVERYLQLLWAAGGGTVDSFPGPSDTGLSVGSEDLPGLLHLVLKSGTVDSEKYWRRLGGMLTLGSLEAMEYLEPSASFQRLVEVNADRLQVSYARTTQSERRRLSRDGLPALSWLVANSRLTLEGPEWSIEFAGDGRHFRNTKHDRPLLSIDELIRRSSGFVVESLKLDDASIAITVEPKDAEDGAAGGAIERWAESLDDIAGVQWATVRNGASITVEFDRLVSSSNSGRIGLSLLAEVAIALTARATGDERAALVAAVTSRLSVTGDSARPDASAESPGEDRPNHLF